MLENAKNKKLQSYYLQNKCQHPHSPFQCWKMVKCKLVLDESVLSTLNRGGEGQNVYRMIFFPTLVTKVAGPNLSHLGKKSRQGK